MMNSFRQSGFNLIELAVVTVVALLAVSGFLSMVSVRVGASGLTAVGVRGRDIYIAITGANTERAPLGLSSVWPADSDSVAKSSDPANGDFNFGNSTDYFRHLYDEPRAGSVEWNPWVSGFDYTKLAGGGVPACTSGKLTPECNIWTIAKNVREDMADTVPVLVTRNIDATTLFSKVGVADFDKRVLADPEWKTPFGSSFLVTVCKGGSVFKAREKYMVCGTVYRKTAFDANVTDKGTASRFPLKYLTPTREVIPGEMRHTVSSRKNLAECVKKRISFEIDEAKTFVPHVFLGWGVVYLVFGIAVNKWRYRKRQVSGVGCREAVLGLIHYLAVAALSFALIQKGLQIAAPWSLTFLPLSLALTAVGVLCVLLCYRGDRLLKMRGIMWMTAVPLVAVSPYVAVLLFWLVVG